MLAHRRVRRVPWNLLLLAPLLLTSCTLGAPTGQSSATAAKSVGAKDCSPLPLKPQDFPTTPKVDNRFYPLVPGMQFFLDGAAVADDGTSHPHRIATVVTDLTKVVDGVHSLVIFELDLEGDQVLESEVFFVAQRKDGSVWTLGEYPEEYEKGKLTGAPSTWISGKAGARAGIAMLARPRVGTPTYLQGLGPEVDFRDCATVFRTGQRACRTLRCYDGVLVIDEFAPLEPEGGHQRKFYAPGVGAVQVASAGGVDPEALKLSRAAKLCTQELSNVRQQALAQDDRAYAVAGDVYSATSRAQQTLDAGPC